MHGTVEVPNGGYAPDPAADWHLLVHDESALPTVGQRLQRRREALSVSPYWRRTMDDERWREVKKAWLAEVGQDV